VKNRVLLAAAFAVALALPVAAQAQGIPGGIAHGANEGNRYAGPVGGLVGGVVGGVVGGIEGVLGVDRVYYADRTVVDRPHRSYRKRKYVRSIRHSRRAARHSSIRAR
jgi:hypothetical protein